jgi:hypothetical protein
LFPGISLVQSSTSFSALLVSHLLRTASEIQPSKLRCNSFRACSTWYRAGMLYIMIVLLLTQSAMYSCLRFRIQWIRVLWRWWHVIHDAGHQQWVNIAKLWMVVRLRGCLTYRGVAVTQTVLPWGSSPASAWSLHFPRGFAGLKPLISFRWRTS